MRLDNLNWENGVLCRTHFGTLPYILSFGTLMVNATFFSCPKIGQELEIEEGKFKIYKIKEKGYEIKIGEEVFNQPSIFYKKVS